MMCEFLPEEITLVEGIICPGPFQHPGMTNGKARVTVLAWSLSDGNQLQQSLCLLGPVPHQTAQPSSAVRLWGWGRSDVLWSYESSSTLRSYLQVEQSAPGCGFLNHHPCCGGLLVMQLAFGSTHSPINYPINSGFTKLHLGIIVSSVCRQCPI